MDKKKNGFHRFIGAALGNPRTQNVTIPLFAILIALLVGAAVLLALGKNLRRKYRQRMAYPFR